MSRLFIIEGPDCTGKTTLAKLLTSSEDDHYIHLDYVSNSRKMWAVQYSALYKASVYLSKSPGNVVIDRHWMSDQIYERVMRGKISRIWAESRAFDRVIRRLCGMYVVCTGKPDEVLEWNRQSTKEEMYMKDDPRMGEVARRYWELLFGSDRADREDYVGALTADANFWSRTDVFYYNRALVKLEDVPHMLTGMISFYDNWVKTDDQLPCAFVHSQGNFLGYLPASRYCFVGEQVNPRKSGSWPFVDYGGSSAFLSSILHDLSFDETEAVWCNAFHDTHDGLMDIVKSGRNLQFIALGDVASRRIKSLGVKCDTVVHPAYAKRFNQRTRLLNELKAIL